MKHLLELQREIEVVRKELNVAAEQELWGTECYQISIKLDKLIEAYMQLNEEEVRLRHCG